MGDGLKAVMLFLASQHPSYVMGFFLLTFCSPIGFATLAFQAWRKDSLRQQQIMATFRADVDKVLDKYGEHVRQLGQQYEANVELVRTTHMLTVDFKELLAMNVQANTRLADVIEKNQFCPVMRKG